MQLVPSMMKIIMVDTLQATTEGMVMELKKKINHRHPICSVKLIPILESMLEGL